MVVGPDVMVFETLVAADDPMVSFPLVHHLDMACGYTKVVYWMVVEADAIEIVLWGAMVSH